MYMYIPSSDRSSRRSVASDQACVRDSIQMTLGGAATHFRPRITWTRARRTWHHVTLRYTTLHDITLEFCIVLHYVSQTKKNTLHYIDDAPSTEKYVNESTPPMRLAPRYSAQKIEKSAPGSVKIARHTFDAKNDARVRSRASGVLRTRLGAHEEPSRGQQERASLRLVREASNGTQCSAVQCRVV